MTINEYKGKFLELFEEMQKEHGAIRFVHIEQNLEIWICFQNVFLLSRA